MPDAPGVVCRELLNRAFVNLRGDAGEARLRHAAAQVAGVEIPREPGTWNHADFSSAYWLGPDEWLLVAEGADGLVIEGRLRDALDASRAPDVYGQVAYPTTVGERVGVLDRTRRVRLDGRFSVADVTGAQVQVELSGTDVGRVLQKSSPYDFHPRNFPPGRCAQTVFAKTTALVAAKEDGAFDLVFRRSYADYLRRWIADAAAEYGYRLD